MRNITFISRYNDIKIRGINLLRYKIYLKSRSHNGTLACNPYLDPVSLLSLFRPLEKGRDCI